MSIAVRDERFILTANQLRRQILTEASVKGKLSGGNS
jgi:hypothetical protein